MSVGREKEFVLTLIADAIAGRTGDSGPETPQDARVVDAYRELSSLVSAAMTQADLAAAVAEIAGRARER
jgi:hypothetical protein